MKKTEMLKKNYEFKNVLTKGKYYSGKQIEAFLKKNNKNYNLLGIGISSKITKAVKRNAIKRLIRENYKNYENKLKESNSIIFLWKRTVPVEEATFESVKEDMKKIFERAKLFKEEWRWKKYLYG